MKNFFKNSLFAATIALLVVSCSSAPEYLNAIPKEVYVVTSVNVAQLIDKANVDSKTTDEFKAKTMEAISMDASSSVAAIVEEILEDPLKSGVDIRKPIYTFVGEINQPIALAQVADKDDFTALLSVMNQEGVCSEVAEGDGYSYALFGEDAGVCYNDAAIVICPLSWHVDSNAVIEYMAELLVQSGDDSFISTPTFSEMTSFDGDIHFMTDFGYLVDQDRELRRAMSDVLDYVYELGAVGAYSFNKGDISLDWRLIADTPEIEEKISEVMKSTKEISGALLKNIPESSIGQITMGIDGAYIWKQIEENPDVKRELPSQYKQITETIITSIDGDITLAVTGADGSIFYKGAMIVESDNSEELALAIKDEVSKFRLSFTEGDKGQYSANIFGMVISLGSNGDKMYLTNDSEVSDNIGGKCDKSLADIKCHTDIKSSVLFYSMSAKQVIALPQVARELRGISVLDSEMIDQISHAELAINKDLSGSLKIVFTNDKVNALELMVDYSSQLAE